MPTAALQQFNVKDELRATAHRRKQGTSSPGAAQMIDNTEGIPQIAARLATMFPLLPGDTVEAVLSGLFRADASLSRTELADRATSALLEMGLAEGSPQALTSFEPRNSGNETQLASSSSDERLAEPPTLPEVRHGTRSGEDAGLDEYLDELLVSFLALPDNELLAAATTLQQILTRIRDNPSDQRVRRLRHYNVKFEASVGRHASAIEMLYFAGFEEDLGDSGNDPGLLFSGDAATAPRFMRALEAVSSVLDSVSAKLPALMKAENGNHSTASTAKTKSPAPDAGSDASGTAIAAQLRTEHPASRDQRRQRVAALTEQRLRDPRAYREQALARAPVSRASGGMILRRSPQGQSSEAAQPSRRARHFTLSDIERMRISDEIAGTPSYADEYIRERQSSPANDYSTLVARSYDPELVARQALDLTNRYRASKGLPPCRWHPGIAAIAARHAQQMATGAMPFSHDGFDDRVRAFPVPQRGAGENLAFNSGVATVAQTAVDGWIKSPGHEKNLRGTWNLCGIGAARSSTGAWYLTQLFALV